ncbi:porin family protein [Capnocytophaga sputigena]|uniref:porin family protein n=1 Tax=Capnocytophaga sputigena TaxID=1019 RepID=UPI0028D38E5C|nr:porin family protein [Capnocytophaga sputigena]
MKRFLTTILWLCAAYVGFAQTAIGVKVTDPLSAVSLAAPLYTATNVDLKNYNAFVSLGGFVRIPLKEHWVLQSELLFKHEAVRFRIENSSKDSYYRFEYLDVPFLVQYEGKKAIRGFGFVGFSPKFLITSSFYDDSKSVTYGGSSQFNTVMMMGHIGGGVLFERPKWIYTVDARFSTSITNLASGSRTEYINFDKARTFVFGISLGAGYKFSKKKNNTLPTEEIVAPTEEVIAPTEEIVTPTEEVNKEPITE